MTPSLIRADDFEAQTRKQPTTAVLEKFDIEHATVQDDPRDWSTSRKVCMARLQRLTIDEYFSDRYPSHCFCRLCSCRTIVQPTES